MEVIFYINKKLQTLYTFSFTRTVQNNYFKFGKEKKSKLFLF